MCVHGRAQLLLLLLLVSHNVKEQRPLCSLLTFFHLSRAFFFVSADIEINMKEVAKKSSLMMMMMMLQRVVCHTHN